MAFAWNTLRKKDQQVQNPGNESVVFRIAVTLSLKSDRCAGSPENRLKKSLQGLKKTPGRNVLIQNEERYHEICKDSMQLKNRKRAAHPHQEGEIHGAGRGQKV